MTNIEKDPAQLDKEAIHTPNATSDVLEDGQEQAEARLDGDYRSDEELNRFIEQMCLSKAEEFHLLGYEHVTGQEVWECVSESYEKDGVPLLHRIVNDILSLKVTAFMNWMTMQAYKRDDLYKELGP